MTLPAVRAVFFDVGNTLVRINYAAIADALAEHGVRLTADRVQRAEWRARVRLDADLLAVPAASRSTETGDTHTRYLRYTLEGLGITDDTLIAAVNEWRSTYNSPIGLWNTVDPANRALLTVSLPALSPGSYKVVGRILSVDTHVSEGDFSFRGTP